MSMQLVPDVERADINKLTEYANSLVLEDNEGIKTLITQAVREITVLRQVAQFACKNFEPEDGWCGD